MVTSTFQPLPAGPFPVFVIGIVVGPLDPTWNAAGKVRLPICRSGMATVTGTTTVAETPATPEVEFPLFVAVNTSFCNPAGAVVAAATENVTVPAALKDLHV